ncbi:ty3-gypsy retrotransposon protein [Cucumis melo var. makuwa]|uniref:Ty3-gypsy retrotransposon protein n=1 Tax=Cucumis melo var. makuwa TaxID=1194695 RepID=A0A5D3BCZ3_CUCMM|nr:ty3-gypsy retrotransposon protein [Cucumis melo var. makuwa]
MSVTMADITVEAAMVETERKINLLMKLVEERDHEIKALREQVWVRETTESSQTPVVKASDKGKNVVQENPPQQQLAFVASLSVQQVQDMIANSIRAQYGGPLQTSFMYSKPYTKRIDNLKMPLEYQPLKFQQFNGKGNIKQHIAHFVETCKNARSIGDQLVRALSLDSKDRITELSTVEMCTQGMHWGLLYILQGIKPRTFEELATRAHDMKLSIDNRRAKNFLVFDVKASCIFFALRFVIGPSDQARLGGGSSNKPYCSEYNVRGSFVNFEQKESLVQFETFEPIVVQFFQTSQMRIYYWDLNFIIDPYSRTTYKLLLGRPWIHGNGVVILTLHQCFKFYQDGVKKVEADSNPFSEAESHFAYAKFYLKNDNSPEAVPLEIPLVNRKDNLQLNSHANSIPPILRYVPLSRQKKDESPKGLKVGDIEVQRESFTTPLTNIKMQETKIDLTEANLPQRQTKDGFDPMAYKLMAKAGYDFTAHTKFKSLKIHEQPEHFST